MDIGYGGLTDQMTGTQNSHTNKRSRVTCKAKCNCPKCQARKAKRSAQELCDFCLGLSLNLLQDVLQQAGLDSSRDCETMYSRVRAEGLGFLTKTLPKLGKNIQQALLGKKLLTTGFKLRAGSALPHFMWGMLSKCFDSRGMVLDDCDLVIIKDLLQVCLTWYKLEVPYDEKLEERVVRKFKRTDKNLPRDFRHLGSCDTRVEPIILAEARSLLHGLLKRFDPYNIVPLHGPGAVSTGEKAYEKMTFKRLYPAMELHYPFDDYFKLSSDHAWATRNDYWNLSIVEEPTARVMLVPKDSRGPRLISAEPLELMFIQQGIGRALVDHIEHHKLTKGHVNFTDQLVNRNLAMKGSLDQSWDTLDMSDASDRVSLALVKELFEGTSLYEILLATRSTHTCLPSGERVRLAKFAPMGSALCFPIEALCFWALGVACLHVNGGLSRQQARLALYVYGDDIIVRGGLSEHLLSTFHYYGLKFNHGKCCTTGYFRESCGCDAYKGHDLNVIKIKSLPPKRSTDGQAYTSWMAIANRLFQACYYRTAEYAEKRIRAIWGDLPFSGRDPHRVIDDDANAINGHDSPEGYVTIDSAPCLYIRTPISDMGLYKTCRYNIRLQRFEYKVLTPNSKSHRIKETERSCRSELFRHIISGLGTTPYLYTLRRRVRLKRRWVCLSH